MLEVAPGPGETRPEVQREPEGPGRNVQLNSKASSGPRHGCDRHCTSLVSRREALSELLSEVLGPFPLQNEFLFCGDL